MNVYMAKYEDGSTSLLFRNIFIYSTDDPKAMKR